ncbi:alpha/beta hydrolase family protein [Haloferula sp. A504]|uniref:alpha/beta hydrolase family protein n=1 Tax=Haloferula sp. A504 TaxID=3373601 RepID=UPI0031C341A8|nr:hypothetical protein [Verrucomicrobiaceae bacterium E54]
MKASLFLLLVATSVGFAVESRYDPSRAPGGVEVMRTEFSHDGREVPLKIYLPDEMPAPVILLSHGLGGSREVGTYLVEHWAARGFAVVAMQHAGSDEAVWKDAAGSERMEKMKSAANGETFMGRMCDVPATLDQLERWNAEDGHFLKGRLDLEKVGMAGHSYGAVTTQAVCGQVFGRAGKAFSDERIDAGLALSPSPPRRGSAEQAFGEVTLPMMLMTGTRDGSPIGNTTPEERREVYPAMPAGSKYELVLDGAEHMAFSDVRRRGAGRRDPDHHRVILALSTAFWESYLTSDAKARAWLDGDGPRGILADADGWQRK